MTPLTAMLTTLALWAAGAFLAAKAVLLLWNGLFLPLTRRSRTRLDERVVLRTRSPGQWLVFFAVLYMGASDAATKYPAFTDTIAWVVLSGAVYVFLVLAVTVVAYGAAQAFFEWHAEEYRGRTHTILNDQFMSLFRKTTGFLFLFIAITIILGHFGVQITGLLATAGVASLAIALAAQETLSNMISGFALISDGAFRPGDRVELANGRMGDVLEVGLRSTRIMTFDNTVITIPNSEIAKNQIVNLNAPNALFKIRSTLGVAYGSDLRKIKALLLDIMQANPSVLKEPAPEVFFKEFGDSALLLYFGCWVADYHDQFRVRDELNMAIKDRFEAEGVRIPFPQREVHLVRGGGA